MVTTSDKRFVTITYKHSGARPPVYVAGSFTVPAWEPQELEAVPVPEGDSISHIISNGAEYVFSRQFQIAVGDWQYKFRLGDGDWWVCDEAADISLSPAGPVKALKNTLTKQQRLTTVATRTTC